MMSALRCRARAVDLAVASHTPTRCDVPAQQTVGAAISRSGQARGDALRCCGRSTCDGRPASRPVNAR
jgi:hypothetical protein